MQWKKRKILDKLLTFMYYFIIHIFCIWNDYFYSSSKIMSSQTIISPFLPQNSHILAFAHLSRRIARTRVGNSEYVPTQSRTITYLRAVQRLMILRTRGAHNEGWIVYRLFGSNQKKIKKKRKYFLRTQFFYHDNDGFHIPRAHNT